MLFRSCFFVFWFFVVLAIEPASLATIVNTLTHSHARTRYSSQVLRDGTVVRLTDMSVPERVETCLSPPTLDEWSQATSREEAEQFQAFVARNDEQERFVFSPVRIVFFFFLSCKSGTAQTFPVRFGEVFGVIYSLMRTCAGGRQGDSRHSARARQTHEQRARLVDVERVTVARHRCAQDCVARVVARRCKCVQWRVDGSRNWQESKKSV